MTLASWGVIKGFTQSSSQIRGLLGPTDVSVLCLEGQSSQHCGMGPSTALSICLAAPALNKAL